MLRLKRCVVVGLPMRPPNPRPVAAADILPSVSLIIPAYNEEDVIEAKLENALELDYPADRLEIVVTSDDSTDGTHAIVDRFAGRGVRLIHCDQIPVQRWLFWILEFSSSARAWNASWCWQPSRQA